MESNYTTKELRNMLKAKKKGKSFSKVIVGSVIALNVFFTLAILYVFLHTGNEPTVLVGAWFAFTTVELWSLSKIKRDEIETEGECDE